MANSTMNRSRSTHRGVRARSASPTGGVAGTGKINRKNAIRSADLRDSVACVHSERQDGSGSTVAIVARIPDVLNVGAQLEKPAHLKPVVKLGDQRTGIVEAPGAQQKPGAARLEVARVIR